MLCNDKQLPQIELSFESAEHVVAKYICAIPAEQYDLEHCSGLYYMSNFASCGWKC